MMKRIINSLSNLRDQAQSAHAPEPEQALSLGLQIDSDKNLQTKGDVVLLYFVYILRMRCGGLLLNSRFDGNHYNTRKFDNPYIGLCADTAGLYAVSCGSYRPAAVDVTVI